MEGTPVCCAPHTWGPAGAAESGVSKGPPQARGAGLGEPGDAGSRAPGAGRARRASWGQEAAAGPARRTVPAGPGGIGARCPSRLPARVPRGLPSHGRLGSGPPDLRTH